MNTFRNLHPVTLLLYFSFVTVFSVFNFNPVYLCFSLLGAALYFASVKGVFVMLKSMAGYFIMLLAVAALNPLFSHNGATALFFINDNRVTLEAFCFGAALGLAIASALCWFSCIGEVFDSEKLLYLFGRASPKLAAVISLSLRLVPGIFKSFKEIHSAQLSFSSNQGRVRRFLSSFSAVITQSLENSIITADSMNARGFALKKRTRFSRFRFTAYDAGFSAFFVLLGTFICVGWFSFEFYPVISIGRLNALNIMSVVLFAVMSLTPFAYEVKEGVKWKLSLSKI